MIIFRCLVHAPYHCSQWRRIACGRGKFYVALTRCRDLRQLKITGVEDFDAFAS